MKTTVIVVSLVANIALIVGILWLTYYSPSRDASVEVQQRADLPTKRIAVILPSKEGAVLKDIFDGFMDTIKKEAQFNPDIKVFDANNNRTLMRSNVEAALADEKGFDVFVTMFTQASQMVKELCEKRKQLVPTVFLGTGDPVKCELVESLDCSNNHLTGVASVGFGWIDQMVSLIPLLAPHVKRVLIPYDPTGLGGALADYEKHFEKKLEQLDYEVTTVEVFKTSEIQEKVRPFISKTDLILVLSDAVMIDGFDSLIKLARQYGVPVYPSMNLDLLNRGATFSYGYHAYDIGVCGADHVRQILEKGIKPRDLPVNRMTNYYRVGINMDNARACKIEDKLDKGIVFLMENGEVI